MDVLVVGLAALVLSPLVGTLPGRAFSRDQVGTARRVLQLIGYLVGFAVGADAGVSLGQVVGTVAGVVAAVAVPNAIAVMLLQRPRRPRTPATTLPGAADSDVPARRPSGYGPLVR